MAQRLQEITNNYKEYINMVRPYSTTITVNEINWKWSRHRDSRQDHNWSKIDMAGRKWFKTPATIYIFGGVFNGRPWGWQIDLYVTIKASARGEYRAQVSIPQLLAYLPMQLQALLRDRCICLDEYKCHDIAFARLKMAFLGHTYPPFKDHQWNEDCHHQNHNQLDDCSPNLIVMDHREHALLHILDGDVAYRLYHPDMMQTGFFDYRIYYQNQKQKRQHIIETSIERKELGLENHRYPKNPDRHFQELVRLHEELRIHLTS